MNKELEGNKEKAVESYNVSIKGDVMTLKHTPVHGPPSLFSFNITHTSSMVGYNYTTKGKIVLTAQVLLINYGSGQTDGYYGPKTREQVMSFQRRWGLPADGIVGPKTWRTLANVEI